MTENNTECPVLYVLMRTDLASMNVGKLAAQACHSGSAFAQQMDNIIPSDAKESSDRHMYNKWKRETPQGFGTVLVLAVNESEMRSAVKIAQKVGFVADVIHDPTYPILVPPELGRTVRTDYSRYKPEDDVYIRPGETDNYVTIDEDTCVYIFGDKNDPMLTAILGNFPLHP